MIEKTAIFAAVLAFTSSARAEGLPKMPRSEVIAAYYLGFSGGAASLDEPSKRRAAAGPGFVLGLTLGMAFWHEFPINIGFGQLFLDDRQPFSEFVVTCTSYGNTRLGCSEAQEEKSDVIGNYFSVDGGYQPRLQFDEAFAVLPGALVGYVWGGDFERKVQCEGCRSIPIPGITASGGFVAPALRLVFGEQQFFAVSARYEWFFSGTLSPMAVFGFEFLAP